MKINLFVFLFFYFNSYINSAIPESSLEYKHVTVVFRHGDRTPDNSEMYPNDPYKSYDFSQDGYGQLTREGKRRAYKLGQRLRTLYYNFLGDYDPKYLVARSTDYDRTKTSLQLVLAGLFPPSDSQIWNENLKWQPIPTTYAKRADDSLLVPILCPRYIAELNRVIELPEMKEEIEKFRSLMQNLTVITGKNLSTPFDFLLLYNVLMAESSMRLPLDKWATDIFPHGLLLNGTVLDYEMKNSNDDLKRLRGGMLLRNITDTMMDIINGTENVEQKITIFSGHDTNVASLLFIFGAYYPHMPEYSSSVMVELIKYDFDYYVRIRYYLGIPQVVKDIQIPGCDVFCPFNDFMVFRHGDRTPDAKEQYPNDLYVNDDFYPLGHGQLTSVGKQREYQLGQTLHTLYNDFLGDIYRPKDLVARSTGFDRTRMSLQLVLSALYPPKGPQVWNESLNWQPILTSYVPEIEDTLLRPFLCLQYKEELKRVLELPELKTEIERFRPLMQNLSVETGKEYSTLHDLHLLFNDFTALKSMNRSLPKWSEDIFPDGLLSDAADLDYKTIFYNDNLKRLRSGMVLRNITDTMKDIIVGKLKTHQKMNIFSAHDQTVAALLVLVSDNVLHVPKYSSSVMVELLRKNDNYFVKARYYLGIPPTVVDLKIPGCKILCPFTDFMELMKNFIPSDEEMECKRH
ncbi:hypothetical protein KQX54_021501 [Cotesia glomerata]|uniref:acid phosphatase n=1 Tax=Cotesia glomerata TaxID=32391 RepID=A0AAV7J9E9_COTGL|nr:hypothetical protein KQX54_021501 [Cotesia glomerata]